VGMNNEGSENRRSSSLSNSEHEETRDLLSYERSRLSHSGADAQSMPPVPESGDYANRAAATLNETITRRRRDRERDREWLAQLRVVRDPAERVAQPGAAQPWVSNRVELSPSPEASPPHRTGTEADELVS